MKKAISLILAAVIALSLSVTALADYENNYVLTGELATDITGVALTQVGCSGDDAAKYGSTSSSFIVWCASQAEISASSLPSAESDGKFYTELSKTAQTLTSAQTPKIGDILILGSDGAAQQTAIIKSASASFLTVLMFEDAQTVTEKLFARSYPGILAVLSPEYKADVGVTDNDDENESNNSDNSDENNDAPDDGSEEKTPGRYMTTASVLNFRAQPSTSAAIIDKIALNTVITVTEISGDWGKTQYGGNTGWIHMDYAVLFDDSHTESSEYAVTQKVIDVSKYQGAIDWQRVAQGGVDGVIIRIGYRGTTVGKLYEDSSFLEYYKGAKQAGLNVGCYFYSAAKTTDQAVEEAEFILDKIKEYSLEFDMPIYIDMEDKTVEATGKQNIYRVTQAFLDCMEQHNYYSGVYASTYWAQAYYGETLFNGHTLWVADWRSSCGYEGSYGMWQYSEKGSVAGIESEHTDLNICYIDFPQLIKDRGYNTGESVPSDERIPGDMNLDGKITASDARTILRIAASLETVSDMRMTLADLNGDGKVTAADARKALRISASLE